jgi:putative ABC transport system substrate-binding protein
LPAVYFGADYIDAGGLISYGPVPRKSAGALRICRQDPERAKPADLPVEEPTVYELAISLKTARTMGLTIPQTYCFGQIG